jgi:hypothetical protein
MIVQTYRGTTLFGAPLQSKGKRCSFYGTARLNTLSSATCHFNLMNYERMLDIARTFVVFDATLRISRIS